MSQKRYAIIVVFLSVIALLAVNVAYTNWVNDKAIERTRQSQEMQIQHFCEVVGTLNNTYHQFPPTTVTGRELAAEMSTLYNSLGCPKVASPAPSRS